MHSATTRSSGAARTPDDVRKNVPPRGDRSAPMQPVGMQPGRSRECPDERPGVRAPGIPDLQLALEVDDHGFSVMARSDKSTAVYSEDGGEVMSWANYS